MSIKDGFNSWPMNRKTSNQIKIASIIAIVCTMLGKVLGLLREMKIAEALGASISSDAYNLAYLLVITIFGLFSSAYSNSLMPIAAEQYTQNKKNMNKTVNEIVTISVVLMLGIVGLMYLFPDFFVKLMAAGMDKETTALTGTLIKISAWALVFLVLISAYVIVMRLYDKNVYPTVVDLLFPVPVLVALFCGVTSPHILIACVVLGYAIKSVALLIGLKTVGFSPKPNFRWSDPKIKNFFCLMPPMLLSSGLLQINTLVDNQVASGFGTGSVTALSLASKVNGLAYTVFSTSLMQIIYSTMTKAYMSGDKQEFKDIVEKQTKMILMFIVPCFIILFNFSTEIISILFVRGNYTQDNAVIAAAILKGYALGLPVYVLRDICMYVYYSAKNSKFPSFVTGASVFINVGLNLILSRVFGIKGVAYATSLAAVFSFAVLAMFMKQKVADVRLISWRNLLIVLISASVSWIVALKLRSLLAPYNVWFNIIAFIIIFAVFWAGCLCIELTAKTLKKITKK